MTTWLRLPTLLSFAGIEPGDLLNEVGGRNLVDILAGKASLPRAAAISSLRRSGYWASLRTSHFKYIVNRDADTETELLFDLGNDAGEQRPLQGKDEGTLSPGARQKFDDLRRALLKRESKAFSLRAIPEGSEHVDLPDRVREELRSLGYIQ